MLQLIAADKLSFRAAISRHRGCGMIVATNRDDVVGPDTREGICNADGLKW
jgi:hypothetical protein